MIKIKNSKGKWGLNLIVLQKVRKQEITFEMREHSGMR